MTNNLIYIASPYAGDVRRNVEFAKAACRYAMAEGHTPVAVHLLYPQFLDDSDPARRAAGLTMGQRVLEACDELWVCGERMPGCLKPYIYFILGCSDRLDFLQQAAEPNHSVGDGEHIRQNLTL